MNCSQAIEYIHSLEKFGIQPGLDRIRALCASLGNPQDKLKVIHVAGTNGKGSTSTIISNILRKAGYNVGLYISPYVTDFRERIQFNGNMIGHYELAQCVSRVKDTIEMVLAPKGIQPTEFEALTAAAFLFYEMKKCDYVVLEVGLGGRFDATNIIKAPLVSVIASISLDHTAILGDTVEKIAFEKCGIIKFGGVCVTYPFQKEAALNVIRETCAEKENTLVVPDKKKISVIKEEYDGTTAVYNNLEFKLPLAGVHMVYNCCTAIEAVKALGKHAAEISDEAIVSGIAASSMPARLELLHKFPITILDGGHNEGCALAMREYLVKHFPGKRIIMVSSLMADKDYDTYLKTVAPLADIYICTAAAVPRALNSDELKKTAEKYCPNCHSISDPLKALTAARNILEPGDVFVVCGSFYLAGEIRESLMNMDMFT